MVKSNAAEAAFRRLSSLYLYIYTQIYIINLVALCKPFTPNRAIMTIPITISAIIKIFTNGNSSVKCVALRDCIPTQIFFYPSPLIGYELLYILEI